MNPVPLRKRPAYAALEAHLEKTRGTHLRRLFEGDPGRAERMSVYSAYMTALRVCRKISRSFLEYGMLLWYGR